MKKTLLVLMLLLLTFSHAQENGGVGLKAGLNYGSNGELKENGQTIIDNPDENIGYHIGVFGKIDISRLYLRPELVYTALNSEYNGLDLEVKKIDAPVLLGFQLIGPLHVFAGPSFQYILDTDLENIDLDDVEEEFTVGIQFGVGVNIGNLGIDVRYEDGISENKAEFVGITGLGSLDTRPQQIIVSLSLKL